MTAIDPLTLYARISSGEQIYLIDVSTAAEYRALHVAGAKSFPLSSWDAKSLAQISRHRTAIFVMCQTGRRSQRAVQILKAHGVHGVIHVATGTRGWEALGCPLLCGKRCVPLQRQVEVTAGLLLIFSAVLSLVIHPLAILLAAFIGVELSLGRISDNSFLGDVLALMPWNRLPFASREQSRFFYHYHARTKSN